MSSADPPPPTPTPWDRLGSLFGDMAAVTSTIASRNMKLWEVPADPRDAYDPERLQADWARWREIAMLNMRDVWGLWLGLSPNEQVAYPVATVYVELKSRIDEEGHRRWITIDPVWIPLGLAAFQDLPEHALVELSGNDADGAAQLARRLHVRLGRDRTSYVLEAHDMHDLVPGAYEGMIYIRRATRVPIAQLRVIVDGAPPDPAR